MGARGVCHSGRLLGGLRRRCRLRLNGEDGCAGNDRVPVRCSLGEADDDEALRQVLGIEAQEPG